MSSKYFLVAVLLLALSCVSESANILIINPSFMYSHHIAFLEIWKELHHRGHNITFTTPYVDDKNLVNFTVIDTRVSTKLMEKNTPQRMGAESPWFLWNVYWSLTVETQSLILALPEMQDIIHNPRKYQFDAVITELWHTNFLAISKIYKCPFIAYATIDMYNALHWHLGNQLNHVTLPDLNVGIYEATNFAERLTSALFTLHELYKEYFVYMPQQQIVLDTFFGKYVDATVQDLKQDIDLMLVNTSPLLRGVRAIGPTTIMVGGGNHLKTQEPLPQHLQTYLDAAKEGFIYVSFGSNVKSKDLEDHVLDVLLEVMGKMPFKILWKYEAEDLPKKPKNVKIVEWAPQQDILRHKNIKLFISQGGVQSMEEAIFSHVPILVMPFFGDQFKNGKLATSKGFGKTILHRPRLDKFELESAIVELTDNPKYKNTAARLAKLMNDSYMTGVEKSVWWIEYVIRNNGTKELRNPAAKLPFYQLYALDVIGFLLAVTIALVTAAVLVCRKISNLLLAVFGSQKALKQKKL